MIHQGNLRPAEHGDTRAPVEADRCCCIHLGMPKTATTCMQLHLFARHSQIAYLGKFPRQKDKFPCPAVQALNRRLSGQIGPGVRRCRAGIAQVLSPTTIGEKVPVWSMEGLTAGGAVRKRRQARTFQRVFDDCKVVIFVRQPAKFMESMYFQNLKGFQKPNRKPPGWGHRFGKLPSYFSLEQWLDVMWHTPRKGAFGHLLCAETADVYADVFGRDRVRVFVFERLAREPDAAIAELCEFVGIDAPEGIALLKGKRENDRWTDTQIERLKQISRCRERSARFRTGNRKLRNELLGFDPRGQADQAPKARAAIPAAWQERINRFARDDHRRLIDHWGLPLEQFGYPL